MSISLSTLPATQGRSSRRMGRGHGSGRGKTAGRGTKGQRSRKGGRRGLIRRSLKHIVARLPKQRGFKSDTPKYLTVTLAALEQFPANTIVNRAMWASIGVIPNAERGIKVLGTGTLSKKLTVHAHALSKTAIAAITKAGGSIVRLR